MFVCCESAIYYVAIARVIFSHVKIDVIFTCEDMFSRESSPVINLIGVYKIKIFIKLYPLAGLLKSSSTSFL